MRKQRRRHTPEFKAHVAFEAIKAEETINDIAGRYQLHPVQVCNWKRELLQNVPVIFERKNAAKNNDDQKERAKLERKLNQLSSEVDWLEKKCEELGIPGKKQS